MHKTQFHFKEATRYRFDCNIKMLTTFLGIIIIIHIIKKILNLFLCNIKKEK